MAIKDHKISVRVTDETYTSLKDQAADIGMSCSDYCRQLLSGETEKIFYDPAMTDMLRQVRDEIRDIAVTINRTAATITDAGDDLETTTGIEVLKEQIRQIYKTIAAYEMSLRRIKEMMEHGDYQAAQN